MIDKGCLYHVVRVNDLECETPSIDSVFVVTDYLEVFPNDLPEIPPEPKIDFSIDLLLDTNPISIPPYRMSLSALTELNFPFKDLLDKGFIKPSIL